MFCVYHKEHPCFQPCIQKPQFIELQFQENLKGRLIAVHIATGVDVTVRVIRPIVAVHIAIRVDVAVEIRGIAVDVGRVNIAALFVQDVPHGKYLNAYFPWIFFIFSAYTRLLVRHYSSPYMAPTISLLTQRQI